MLCLDILCPTRVFFYFTFLLLEPPTCVFVSAGGWTSSSVPYIASSISTIFYRCRSLVSAKYFVKLSFQTLLNACCSCCACWMLDLSTPNRNAHYKSINVYSNCAALTSPIFPEVQHLFKFGCLRSLFACILSLYILLTWTLFIATISGTFVYLHTLVPLFTCTPSFSCSCVSSFNTPTICALPICTHTICSPPFSICLTLAKLLFFCHYPQP
jgi:hypothetical protein